MISMGAAASECFAFPKKIRAVNSGATGIQVHRGQPDKPLVIWVLAATEEARINPWCFERNDVHNAQQGSYISGFRCDSGGGSTGS